MPSLIVFDSSLLIVENKLALETCYPCCHFLRRYHDASDPDIQAVISGVSGAASCGFLNGTWLMDDSVILSDCTLASSEHTFIFSNIGTGDLVRLDVGNAEMLLFAQHVPAFGSPADHSWSITNCPDIVAAIDELFDTGEVELPVATGDCTTTTPATLELV
jgi:hypothetical protein